MTRYMRFRKNRHYADHVRFVTGGYFYLKQVINYVFILMETLLLFFNLLLFVNTHNLLHGFKLTKVERNLNMFDH